MSEHSSHITTDHDTIKRWALERGGQPTKVVETGDTEQGIGILRINFAGDTDENLQPISWEEFFEEFENSNLAFLYQEHTADGQPSRFNKLVSREK